MQVSTLTLSILNDSSSECAVIASHRVGNAHCNFKSGNPAYKLPKTPFNPKPLISSKISQVLQLLTVLISSRVSPASAWYQIRTPQILHITRNRIIIRSKITRPRRQAKDAQIKVLGSYSSQCLVLQRRPSAALPAQCYIIEAKSTVPGISELGLETQWVYEARQV